MSKKCLVCQKSVYPMDPQINLDGSLFHKSCAKCADCQCQITISNFTKTDTTLLCKTHYFKRFNEEGSYLGGDKFSSKSSQDARKDNASGASAVKPVSSVSTAGPVSFVPKSAPVSASTGSGSAASSAPRSFLPSALKGGNNSSSWIRKAAPDPTPDTLPTPPTVKSVPAPVVSKEVPVPVAEKPVKTPEPVVEASEPVVEASEPVVEAPEPAVEAPEPVVDVQESFETLTTSEGDTEPSTSTDTIECSETTEIVNVPQSETEIVVESETAVVVEVKSDTIEAVTEEMKEEECESV